MLVKLNNEKELEELIKNNQTVIVDFSATWCGPCRMLKPIFEETSEEITDTTFISVDVDDFNRLAAIYNIRSVPTLIGFKNGNVVKISVGSLPKDSLVNFINQVKNA